MVTKTNIYKRESEGIFGTKAEDYELEIRYQILYLDERVFVLRRTAYFEETAREPVTQIYERLLSEEEAESVRLLSSLSVLLSDDSDRG